MSMLCLHVLDVYACVVFFFSFFFRDLYKMHSLFIVLCVSVKWMLCKIPFASILSKSVIQNRCCMPCYFFFFSFSPLRCIMLNALLVSQAVDWPWCNAHRLEVPSSPERDTFWKEIEGEIIIEKETRSINKNSVVWQWYPFLPCRFYRPCSASPFISVGKGRTVVFENWVGCAPQADTWEHLGNIDPWITTDKLCLYKLFSVCSH